MKNSKIRKFLFKQADSLTRERFLDENKYIEKNLGWLFLFRILYGKATLINLYTEIFYEDAKRPFVISNGDCVKGHYIMYSCSKCKTPIEFWFAEKGVYDCSYQLLPYPDKALESNVCINCFNQYDNWSPCLICTKSKKCETNKVKQVTIFRKDCEDFELDWEKLPAEKTII
ncbi:MAG: hypothetical protein ACTSU2_08520 [Promethearchaeota archaeon]